MYVCGVSVCICIHCFELLNVIHSYCLFCVWSFQFQNPYTAFQVFCSMHFYVPLPPIPTLCTVPSSAIFSVDDEGVSAADVALMKSKVTIQYIKDFPSVVLHLINQLLDCLLQ